MTTFSIQQDNLQLDQTSFATVHDAVEELLGAVGITVLWQQPIHELPVEIQNAYEKSLNADPSSFINI